MRPLASLAAAALVAAAAVPGTTVVPLDRPTATSHKDAQQRDSMVADRRRQQRLAENQREALAWAARLVRWKYPKPGHSVKQGQRRARKARNRRRSK